MLAIFASIGESNQRLLKMLASDSLHPSTLASLLTCLYGATELHDDSMGANDGHESVMTLVNIHSHAQMIYLISVTAHRPSFPVVCTVFAYSHCGIVFGP